MKYFLLLMCISFSIAGWDNSSVVPCEITEVPEGIAYQGSVKRAVQWDDSMGTHIVITAETGVYRSTTFDHVSDGVDAELFAYHFRIHNDSVVRLWRVYDFIADCPVDIEASFLEETPVVTDLNKDGTVEIWLLYRTACRGDVSPSKMKIIMYQGTQKFAMRGESRVFVGKDESGTRHYLGGKYAFDAAFNEGPRSFREFAKQLWDNNVVDILNDLPE
jgi:hypothetical protein